MGASCCKLGQAGNGDGLENPLFVCSNNLLNRLDLLTVPEKM